MFSPLFLLVATVVRYTEPDESFSLSSYEDASSMDSLVAKPEAELVPPPIAFPMKMFICRLKLERIRRLIPERAFLQTMQQLWHRDKHVRQTTIALLTIPDPIVQIVASAARKPVVDGIVLRLVLLL